jgi:hypothetical protein
VTEPVKLAPGTRVHRGAHGHSGSSAAKPSVHAGISHTDAKHNGTKPGSSAKTTSKGASTKKKSSSSKKR